MKTDVSFIETRDEIVIHCNNPKAAGWIARYVTTNVAPLHCEKKNGAKLLRDMQRDGLKTKNLDADMTKRHMGDICPACKLSVALCICQPIEEQG